MTAESETTPVVLRSPHRVGLAVAWLAIAALTVLLHVTVSPSASLGLAAFFAVLAVVAFLLSRWIGVVLTPTGLADRGVTTRRLAWSDIRSIEATENIATRYVVVHLADGRRQQLRLPTVALGTGGKTFDRDLALINRYWSTHRGPDGPPPVD